MTVLSFLSHFQQFQKITMIQLGNNYVEIYKSHSFNSFIYLFLFAWQKERCSSFLFTSHKGKDWVNEKPGAWKSMYVGIRDSAPGAITCCLLGCVVASRWNLLWC